MAEREQGGQAGPEMHEEAAEAARPRTGRFTVSHRGDTRVEVSEPVRLPLDKSVDKPWFCTVKLVGPKKRDKPDRLAATPDVVPVDPPSPSRMDDTQTLLVRTGRGNSGEEAQRDAMAQLSLLYGTPTAAPPEVVITRKPSEPPPAMNEAREKPGFWAWVKRVFART